MSTSKHLHIFKPGRQTAMSGAVLDFSESDLAASARAYDPALHEAPIVIGHPKHDAPAYGWVKSLAASGDGLNAEPHQVDADFAELVASGRYKKISASFYLPDAPNNPVPGVYYLRHVGFLGAQPPAVKGLKQAEFADAAYATVPGRVYGRPYLALGIADVRGLVGTPNLRVDGRGFSVKGHEQGYFVGPTLFDNVTPEMTIYKEEIFGPVLSVVRVADYASAVDLINRHEYGNGSAIFTRDGGCARRFCEEVQAGMVGVNVPIPVPMAFHSFGGWKRSIFGALNVHGSDGVRFYTRMKTITARWPEMQQETGAAFSMPTLG